ncbi:MAG: DNA repair protein RadA [candidate division Zixibacteria bacterium]|nr:DNA repair protein RadA [candidate division Zixibacteria bacterium]
MAKQDKIKTRFFCQNCGSVSPKWLGKCADCGSWNTYVEEKTTEDRSGRPAVFGASDRVMRLAEVDISEDRRLETGIGEFDRVLGGGVVHGSVILIGGDPGIGKSTLMLQALQRLGACAGPVLYVSGEESSRQVRLRADRLGVVSEGLYLLCETNLDEILHQVEQLKPRVIVLDSVQTIYLPAIESAPGSISQVRECAARVIQLAKTRGTPVFLIGHVTKEGAIAGPRALEHIVDTVLYFEGERHQTFRILRAVKNRFGSTNEIGIFEMQEQGLTEVANPSELFLEERPANVSGSVVVCSMEGTRPLLVELQALVTPANYGMPQRVSTGIEGRRVSLLLAVLEKRAGMSLGAQDVFVNVAGGVRLEEPAVDLGVAAAVASSLRDAPVSPHAVVIGEIGLGGEVRGVAQMEKRLHEAQKLGFTRCVVSARNLKGLPPVEGMEVVGVNGIYEALEALEVVG